MVAICFIFFCKYIGYDKSIVQYMNILTAIFLHFPRKDLKQNCLYSRRFFSGAALHDLAAHHHAEPVMDGDEADDDDDAMNNPYEDPDSLEGENGEMDIDGFIFMDSDSDDDDAPNQGHDQKIRLKAASSRPEFVELQALNLTNRPEGYTIGVHEANKVWRTSCPGSKHFGRTWGEGSGRSPKQALIRVLILMLTEYCETNNSDRLAKKQLKRLEELWSSNPGKP